MTVTTHPRRSVALHDRVRQDLSHVVAVDPDVLHTLLATLLAGGHALIEGIPGTGKTLLARTLARLVGLPFRRIQFTNDLMPSDIVGSSVWRPDRGGFEFVPGPLFTNLVLADEINRTSPRTLSCLLEAMENAHVSVDGVSRLLADPFFLLATRNPLEFHGTFPMPEAALDRFLVRVHVRYPEPQVELGLYLGEDPERRLEELEPVLDRESLLGWRAEVSEVKVRDSVARYCQEVVRATREEPSLALGASPRAALGWLRIARAYALLDGRDYVVPDDLRRSAVPVLAHRLVAEGEEDSAAVVTRLLASVPVEL